jgi:hypothetical protein
MDISSKSLSRGVGGSYTKWQRKPPAHRVYQVETPEGKTVITVYAEERALDDPDHPVIQKIENSSSFAKEIEWKELSPSVKENVRKHLAEKVKNDDWFQD